MAPLPEPAPLDWVHRALIFPIGRIMAWIVLLPFGRARVRGKYRVPREGGVLILSNHRADVDPMLVQLACPRNVRFMAKSDLFDIKVLGWLLRTVAAFPVRRGEPDKGAIKYAVKLLQLGEPVCVFPEGQLTETGELQEIKPGVALIMRMAQVPVICLGLRNTEFVLPYGKLVPRPTLKKLEATWGEARSFDRETPVEDFLGWVEGQLRELTE